WPTARRGRILIHAARVSDHRPEAWAKLPLELHDAARLLGGIIGEAELTGCREYTTRDVFAADQERHLNDATWFEGPKLYGFTFANVQQLPFHKYPGWMRFFEVDEDPRLAVTPLTLPSPPTGKEGRVKGAVRRTRRPGGGR